jgi:hypothetical protein
MLKMKTQSDCGPVAIALYLEYAKQFVAIQIYARIIELMSYPNTEDWKDDMMDNPFHHINTIYKRHFAIESRAGVALLFTNQSTFHWVWYGPDVWHDGHKIVLGRLEDSPHTILMSYSFEHESTTLGLAAILAYAVYHVLVSCIVRATMLSFSGK